MKEKKAQVATEYMLVIGMLLVMVAGLAGYSLFMYSETVTLNEVKDSLNDLQAAVNRVYSLGEGNSVIVKIALPAGVTETRVIGNAIYITTTLFAATSQDFVQTDANVHGSIPAEAGIHYIEVKATDGNVSLGET
jgi:uncharacterized protein (UPF0333 family)